MTFRSALGGAKQLEPYGSEPSKRHTMSYEPDTIPDMEHIDQRPSPIKKQKEKVCCKKDIKQVLFLSRELKPRNGFVRHSLIDMFHRSLH